MKQYNKFYNRDCMEGMKGYPDNYFELAICDPPYGIGISKVKTMGKTRKSHTLTFYEPKKWDNEIPDKKYFDELFRVSKNQIIFGMNYFLENLKSTKCFVVWDKKMGGNNYSMAELIYTSFDKPSKIFRHYRAGNCVSNNPEKAKQHIKIHTTQKPVALYQWLLQNYAKKGDKILDTHVGSGSSIIACIEEGYNYVGFELDKDYHDAAVKRINEFKEQGKLF